MFSQQNLDFSPKSLPALYKRAETAIKNSQPAVGRLRVKIIQQINFALLLGRIDFLFFREPVFPQFLSPGATSLASQVGPQHSSHGGPYPWHY